MKTAYCSRYVCLLQLSFLSPSHYAHSRRLQLSSLPPFQSLETSNAANAML